MKKNFLQFVLILILSTQAFAQETVPSPEIKIQKSLSIGILADNSGSFRKVLDYVDKTVQQIVTNFESGDEGFIVRFIGKDKIGVLEDFTTDKEVLRQACEEMFIEGGDTAISEALLFSAKHLVENGKNERKILILVSDGDNRSEKSVHAEAVKYLKENNIAVYVVGITFVLETKLRDSEKFIQKLASDTGGGAVIVPRAMGSTDAANAVTKLVRAPMENGK